MSNTNQQVQIDVFYGDRPAHDSERRPISVVREALQRQGISAVLLVNFFLPRGSRQLDLVIVTDQRCVVVELKSLDPTLALIATVNGPSQQLLPEGSRRVVANRNYYHQAREQTHGLSEMPTPRMTLDYREAMRRRAYVDVTCPSMGRCRPRWPGPATPRRCTYPTQFASKRTTSRTSTSRSPAHLAGPGFTDDLKGPWSAHS